MTQEQNSSTKHKESKKHIPYHLHDPVFFLYLFYRRLFCSLFTNIPTTFIDIPTKRKKVISYTFSSNKIKPYPFSQIQLDPIKLKNANVLFERGYTIYKNSIVTLASYEIPKQKKIIKLFEKSSIPKKHKTISCAAICTIPTDIQNNYYHWMINALPKIMKALTHTNTIVINSISQPFQKEILTLIKKKYNTQFIECTSTTNIHVKRAFVSLQECSYTLNDAHHIPSSSEITAIASLLEKEKKKTKKQSYSKKIYITRGDAFFRNITNETQIINILKKMEFTIITIHNMSIQKQYELFSNADIIIAPHGAALTNIIFCKRNTHIVELFHPEYINHFYLALAKKLHLSYDFIIAENETKENIEPRLKNFSVPTAKLTQFLKK